MAGKKDPRKQYLGKLVRAMGKRFEDRLARSFEYYQHTGMALVEKTPEPMRILRRLDNGKFIACFEKKAQPDYKGTIKGGRTVVFEAKFTSSDKIEESAVLQHQADYMDMYTALGARSFVLVGFASGNVYKVPWGDWKTMKQRYGHKHATEAELEPYRVKTAWNDTLMIFD